MIVIGLIPEILIHKKMPFYLAHGVQNFFVGDVPAGEIFLYHPFAFASEGVILAKNEVGKNKPGKSQKIPNPKVHHFLIPTG
jgi:hypothetical protein